MSGKKRGRSYCLVHGCFNRTIDGNFTFFGLPKESERINHWLTVCFREDLFGKTTAQLKSYRICAAHFEDKMFTNFLKKRLLPKAVPTIFPFVENIGSDVQEEHAETECSRKTHIHSDMVIDVDEGLSISATTSESVVCATPPAISDMVIDVDEGLSISATTSESVVCATPPAISGPRMCWAQGCGHHNQRKKCEFFEFPKNPLLRSEWILKSRRDDEPGPDSLLCSCHFRDSDRRNVPDNFAHNRQQSNSPSPKKRKLQIPPEKDKIATVSSNARKLEETSNQPQPKTSNHCPSSQQPETYLTSSSYEEIEHNELSDPQLTTSQKKLPVLYAVMLKCNKDSQPSTPSEEVKHDKVTDLQPTTPQKKLPLLLMMNCNKGSLETKSDQNERTPTYLKGLRSFKYIENNDQMIFLYTGLSSARTFDNILALVSGVKIENYYNLNSQKLNRKYQLLLTLMKLRQNFPLFDLATRFGVSEDTAANVIITWVRVLHNVLFLKMMDRIPDQESNGSCLPNCCNTFSRCRVIIDFIQEIRIVPTRKSMVEEEVNSDINGYKNNWKGLIGIAPNGFVIFASSLYPGATSDKKIVHNCGILKHLNSGDLIVADKGSLMRDILPPGVILNLTPFWTRTKSKSQELNMIDCVSRARVNSEGAIGRMEKFQILRSIPTMLRPCAKEVFQLIEALSNIVVINETE